MSIKLGLPGIVCSTERNNVRVPARRIAPPPGIGHRSMVRPHVVDCHELQAVSYARQIGMAARVAARTPETWDTIDHDAEKLVAMDRFTNKVVEPGFRLPPSAFTPETVFGGLLLV